MMDLETVVSAIEKMQKTNIALKIVDGYFVHFERLGEAYGAMDPSITPIKDLDKEGYIQNHVVLIGDWMDTVAHIYTSGLADTELLQELGIPNVINNFRMEIEKRRQTSSFVESYCPAWKHLLDFQISQQE